MEITKREIIASISILAILLMIGVLIGNKVTESEQDRNAMYNKALKITSKDMFEYSMKTNTGNAFVEGELQAVEPVTYEEDLEDKYLVVEKVTERYTMHTKTVTTSDSKGKTHTRIETYWTWDVIARDSKVADEVTFLGVKFKTSQFNLPGTDHIKTVKEPFGNIRHKYYGLEPKFKATLFSNLRDNNITQGKDRVTLYRGMNIAETLESLTTFHASILFWFVWIVLCIGMIYQFVYAENDWLNKD